MSRLSACGPGCGWCGRCDDRPRPEKPEPELVRYCMQCGARVLLGGVSIAGQGQYCSWTCADIASLAKDAAERRQRRIG